MSYQLEKALELEALDLDLFRSVSLWTPRGARGTFGGQLAAHATEAAMRTVGSDLAIHSLHSNFLGAGNSKKSIYYRVRRLRDGKSFGVRLVTANQEGKAIYVATISFHRPEQPGLQHYPSIPKTMPPEEAPTEADVMQEILDSPKIPESFKENVRRKMNRGTAPVQIRYCNPGSILRPVKSFEPQYTWFRANTAALPPQAPRDVSGGSDRAHLHIACWLSDFTLAFAGIRPHGFPNTNVSMIVSLDHTIYFHTHHFKADDWFLYEVRTSWGDHNRCLCHGRIFTADGHLAITTTQEVLVRMKKGYNSKAKL